MKGNNNFEKNLLVTSEWSKKCIIININCISKYAVALTIISFSFMY